MAQFDLYLTGSNDLLLDCQSDLLSHYNSRLVVPLIPVSDELPSMRRLNPIFSIDGIDRMMMTEFAAAISIYRLGQRVGSLADHDLTIKTAFDVLITGY